MADKTLRLLGANIRRLRRQQHLTQEAVADASSLNSSYFGRLERGEVNATLETLLSVCRDLNIELRDLFQEELGTVDQKRLRTELVSLVGKMDAHDLRLLLDLLTRLHFKA
jgi:transcriptional regulator with XRE-family HTH domain